MDESEDGAMTEWYPEDGALLAMESDAGTGVEYIPTGLSPYYLEFRKLVWRLLEAARRANDFRVYRDGDMTVGVRGGRCVIGGVVLDVGAVDFVGLTNNAVNQVWLDEAGVVSVGVFGFPEDRSTYLPLAEVTTEAGLVTGVVDVRGEGMWSVPSLSSMGVEATAEEVNRALSGIDAGVTWASLNLLTGGPTSTADLLHRHEEFENDADAETGLLLSNDDGGASAGLALRFALPGKVSGETALVMNDATGWLEQRRDGESVAVMGSASMQWGYGGELTAGVTGELMGVVPYDGTITDVVLSVGQNVNSSNGSDGLSATVKVNGVAVTTVDPALTDAAGIGFKSTGQGHGTAGVVSGSVVERGDVVTVDVTRTVSGTVSIEARDVVVLVVMRPSEPV